MAWSPSPARQARSLPDVRAKALVRAPRTRPQLVLPEIRRRAGCRKSALAPGGLPTAGTAGGRARAGHQGRLGRLQDVRAVRAELDRHVLPDELPQTIAQWTLWRRARERQLRGQARDALRVGRCRRR